MKKITSILIVICILLGISINAKAGEDDQILDLFSMFDQHGAVMLLIDMKTGEIVYANNAAASFYGYSKEQLLSMKISQIEEVSHERNSNKQINVDENEQQNFLVTNQRMANGEIRTIEEFSCPIKYGDKNVYFIIMHDISAKTQLEEKDKGRTAGIIIIGFAVIIILLIMIGFLIKNYRKLKKSKKELENLDELRKTFINADDSIIYLKDENLRYVFVNNTFEKLFGKKASEVIGQDDFAISEAEFAEKRRETDLAVLASKSQIVDKTEWAGRIYKTTKFPVKMLNGEYGIGAHVEDITEEYESEKRRNKALQRNKILVDVLSIGFTDSKEQLDYVLHQSLELTESQYGYIYFYDEDSHEFTLNTWTRGVMEECAVIDPQTKYQLEKTGIWGEVVRQRKPIILNDFEKPNSLKKGYPEGHVQLKKFMSLPVIMDGKIVAVVGLANKLTDYDDNDVYEITLLMSGAWQAVKRREAQENLSLERNRYLQTLRSIGDGVMVVDRSGIVRMLNPVAQKLVGWMQDEAVGRHYKEVFLLSHERQGFTINDPVGDALTSGTVQEMGNEAMLTSKEGVKYNLEDSAAPIKDDSDKTVGVVLVFRDVTDKKKQKKEIEYLSYHDSLTGLYNRRFMEEEMHRLDSEKNLPLSVVMGDLNELKLINDIFGHAAGDELLKKIAAILLNTCRVNDIIARWGGDEYLIFLPKTDKHEVERIISRIKSELSKQHTWIYKESISMGYKVKQNVDEDIAKLIRDAEEMMYFSKTIEKSKVSRNAINSIIAILHDNSSREKEHSKLVSKMCQEFGRTLGLSEVQTGKLKEAGYLHDIGKVTIDKNLLNKGIPLTNHEMEEVKKHVTTGYRILNCFDNTMDLADPILAHHEHWDGTGYPKGLKGEEIPLLARIIAIVETYDRIIHSGNVRTDTIEEAIRIIRENIGTKFDPNIANAFIQYLTK